MIQAVRFSNFRNIRDQFTVPLERGITFLVGPNNVGKSNIFRLLAIGLEQRFGDLDNDLDFESDANKTVNFDIEVSKSVFEAALTNRQIALRYIAESGQQTLLLSRNFTKEGTTNDGAFAQQIFQIVPRSYFQNQNDFIRDFGSFSTDMSANLHLFMVLVWNQIQWPKTAFVPSDRHILASGQQLNRFDARTVPSSTQLEMNAVVQSLADLDRPHGDQVSRNARKARLQKIEEFLGHCLEAKQVKIIVPTGQQTVYVNINDVERPLSGLGSGIEQLILIGLGMSNFEQKVVMIDEPELHLHPRTQKLMMQYLLHRTSGKFIIATHSSSALDAVEARIIKMEGDGRRSTGKTIENRNDLFQAIRNLGHSASELVQANFVIWVEGPSDRIYLNHLIQKFSPTEKLTEGIDYSIVMYGGAILAQHSFEDTSEDFFKALSISRQFAVYADSDKSEVTSPLKVRLERVREETENSGGLIWISAGREIENYIPASVVSAIVGEFSGVSVPADEFGHVLDGVDKVKFARRAIDIWQDEWPLDLRSKVEALVHKIKAAK